jgi:hypothetical protein
MTSSCCLLPLCRPHSPDGQHYEDTNKGRHTLAATLPMASPYTCYIHHTPNHMQLPEISECPVIALNMELNGSAFRVLTFTNL